jgi:hypothetical protein
VAPGRDVGGSATREDRRRVFVGPRLMKVVRPRHLGRRRPRSVVTGYFCRVSGVLRTAHIESRMSRSRWVGWTGLGWATPCGGQARIRSHRPELGR